MVGQYQWSSYDIKDMVIENWLRKFMHNLKCTQMRAYVEKVDVLGWNKYETM